MTDERKDAAREVDELAPVEQADAEARPALHHVVVGEDEAVGRDDDARAEAFRGSKPAALAALELVENQTARLERKLFIHNGGHAACGYFGFHRGHRYIHEAVADPDVARRVLATLDELAAVVQKKWGFSQASIDAYKQDLCRRGAVHPR